MLSYKIKREIETPSTARHFIESVTRLDYPRHEERFGISKSQKTQVDLDGLQNPEEWNGLEREGIILEFNVG